MPAKKVTRPSNSEDSNSSASVPQQMMEALRDYERAVNQAYIKARQAANDAHSEFERAHNEAQLTSQKAAEEAYRNYIGSVQEAYGDDNAMRLVQEAHDRHTVETQEAAKQCQDLLKECCEKNREAVNEAEEDAKANYKEACDNFVKTAKDCWSRLSPDSVSAEDLMAVGTVLCTAGQFAHSTLTSPHACNLS